MEGEKITPVVEAIRRERQQGVAKAGRPQAPPFVRNLYDVVDDARTDDVISWTTCPRGQCDDGVQNCFEVKDFDLFTSDLLPKLCHSKSFCSFVRQLNGYGFSKSDPKRAAFSHKNFRRGEPDRLVSITRRKTVKRRAKSSSGDRKSRGKGKATNAKKRRSGDAELGAGGVAWPEGSIGAVPAALVEADSTTRPDEAKPRVLESSHELALSHFLAGEMDAGGANPLRADIADTTYDCLSDALGTLQSVLVTVETASSSLSPVVNGPALRVIADVASTVRLFVQRQLPNTRPGFLAKRHEVSLSEQLGSLIESTNTHLNTLRTVGNGLRFPGAATPREPVSLDPAAAATPTVPGAAAHSTPTADVVNLADPEVLAAYSAAYMAASQTLGMASAAHPSAPSTRAAADTPQDGGEADNSMLDDLAALMSDISATDTASGPP